MSLSDIIAKTTQEFRERFGEDFEKLYKQYEGDDPRLKVLLEKYDRFNDFESFLATAITEAVREAFDETRVEKKLPTEDQENGLEFDEGWDGALDEIIEKQDRFLNEKSV